MKRLFSLFTALLLFVAVYAESYSVRVYTGSSYKDYLTTATGEEDFQGRKQFVASSVSLNKNDNVVCYDNENSAEFPIVVLDQYGAYQRFTATQNGIICNTAGSYNIYVKLKWEDNMIYIEDANGTIGGGDDSGNTDCQDGPYGIQINGETVVNAVSTGDVDFQGRTQYIAHVRLEKGDVCKLINTSCGATWMVDLDPYDEYVNFDGGKAAGQITCKKAGCYDFYIKLMMNDDLLYIGPGTECGKENGGGGGNGDDNKGSYGSAVPSQCTDVLLQGFYYDSYTEKTYNGTKFHNTKWSTLLSEASEIGNYFDMVWLPPSAKSSGGTGYHPSQYSNQNSAWGSRAELDKLIAAFHSSPRKTKVIADIVVNHMDNKSSWCDFWEQDFGEYNVNNKPWQPLASWITSNDELASSSTAGSCRGKQGSVADDGYGDEANYAAARDLAHSNVTVQNFVIAYLKWMYNVVGYDGWRYDYCKGFNTWHVSNYNKKSGAYFSVMEYWDGNVDVLRSRLQEAEWNTLTFDFATKYEAFNRGIAAGNYAGCKGSGMLGAGLSKHAVTFIDSHDSFQRDDNEMCGKGNSLNNANKAKVLQANAFILSMPGIPCVFYPHWQVFKTNIQKMIMARHAAQVHSESAVSDEATNSGYKATITGKNGGSIVLLLGNRANDGQPSGYTLADKGTGYAVYYKAASNAGSETLTLSVEPGTSVFKDNQKGLTVKFTATALSGTPKIYYTTNGQDPTTSSQSLSSGQTLTFKETTTLKVMAVCGNSKTAVQTYTYTYKAPQTTPIVVRFNSNGQWEKVYLYTWGDADLGKWPGTLLTPDKDGWVSYQFDASVKSVSFIFNCGNSCSQTTDLKTDEDVCYVWEGGTEKLVEDCVSTTAVEEVKTAVEVEIYPNPVKNVINITSDSNFNRAWIYSVTGQCWKQENGNIKQIEVSDIPSGLYLLRLENNNGEQTTNLFVKE